MLSGNQQAGILALCCISGSVSCFPVPSCRGHRGLIETGNDQTATLFLCCNWCSGLTRSTSSSLHTPKHFRLLCLGGYCAPDRVRVCLASQWVTLCPLVAASTQIQLAVALGGLLSSRHARSSAIIGPKHTLHDPFSAYTHTYSRTRAMHTPCHCFPP